MEALDLYAFDFGADSRPLPGVPHLSLAIFDQYDEAAAEDAQAFEAYDDTDCVHCLPMY